MMDLWRNKDRAGESCDETPFRVFLAVVPSPL